MAVIGDQFDVGSEICGIVLSIRGAEDILSIWNQSAHEGRINLKIRDTMKRILSLPADTIMEYKTHNDALKDNTSFRNTDVFRWKVPTTSFPLPRENKTRVFEAKIWEEEGGVNSRHEI